MDIQIEGRHALLFDDDANAAFVNSRAALVPWTGDESLLIDRYDVRHLLDRMPPRPKKLRFVEETGGVSQSELDLERFLDLPPDNNDEDGDERETSERSEATGFGPYQAVPFSYGNNDGSADPNSSESNHCAFYPPFPVPTSLLSNLPHSEKLHQIMVRTAIFVSEHGGQSEIVLRVKQGDNPTFGFLMPDNQLHPYFRFLVDHPQLIKSNSTQDDNKSDGQENEAVATRGGALSLLGSVYGTEEDDDNAPQPASKEGESSKLNADDNPVFPHQSVKEESASAVSLEDRKLIKRSVGFPTKEKSLLPKKNHFINCGSIVKKGEVNTSQHGIVHRPSSEPDKSDAKPPVLEPPSFLKRTIDKIVEFILRNGKEFEAVLIEQDKTAGRFPFLLPSNQYHSYYLKVLDEALESKSLSKNPSDGSKRRAQEAIHNEATTDEEFESWSLDLKRKEKFKMVIGSKKESNDQPSKPVRKSGVTADEAAAIVLAATRGRSPASALQTASVADSDTGRASSIGSLSLHQPHEPISNSRASNGKVGVAVATANVTVATAVAKTVALATASEADSSEASLTKEQKLKAERLKRAKMFAAMIKSGVHPTTQLVNSGGTQSGAAEPSTACSNHEEKEGSSVAFDTEASHKERNYRKKQHSRSKDNEEDTDEDHKHSRKKHRSDDHKHRKDKGSRHRHSHRRNNLKHHSDSEDEYRHEKSHHKRHRHRKHFSDSESEDGHGKSSRNRHGHGKHDLSDDEDRDRSHKHHRKHDLSDDEDRERSHKHRRKHHLSPEKKEEIEEGEVCERSLDQFEVHSRVLADHVEEAGAATDLDAKASDVTEVPSDLRAKIRAMLLETI